MLHTIELQNFLYIFTGLLLIKNGCASIINGSQKELAPNSGNFEIDSNIYMLSNEIKQWMEQSEQSMSNMPPHLKQMVNVLNQTTELQAHDSTDRMLFGLDYCLPCEILGSLVIGYSRIGLPIDLLADFLVKICFFFFYQNKAVCQGLIYQEKDRLNYIIRNTNVDSAALCSLVLGSEGCGPFQGPSWTVSIPSPTYYGRKKPHISNRLSPPQTYYGSPEVDRLSFARSIDGSRSKYQQVSDEFYYKNEKKVLKVLHLTDPHFDPDYIVGSNAVCNAPLCCNDDSGRVEDPSHKAGKWGDYRDCDSPKWLIENMLHHITTNHPDIDYILCTGDLVPHHIWKITKGANLKVIKEVGDMILHFFPDTPVYGAIGNHESFPRDSYPPPEVPEVFSKFGNKWLYDAVTTSWEKLMKQSLPATSRFAGYYSVIVRSGFRLISLNTNFCYIQNWWVLYKPIDPGNVLRWLVKELQEAEKKREFVHIIGHIPPLYVDCYDQWAHQFSRIVSRYSNIIRGQFYGHSHLDEFRIHYDVKNSRIPVGVEYVTPNNGPFTNLNPSYRIFSIDGDHEHTTRHVLDYDTYVMNLTHANVYNDPQWYKLYSAKKDLELPDLLPHSWDKFARRLAKEPAFFQKYYRYQVQDSDPSLYKGCDLDCRRKSICALVEGDVYLPKKCKHSKKKRR